MKTKYTLEDIKFSLDEGTWERSVYLYDHGKVTEFKEHPVGFHAIVKGTHPYSVFVASDHFDRGQCDCYLGERDEYCKHMGAVGIYSIKNGGKLTDKERVQQNRIEFINEIGLVSSEDLSEIKKSITRAMTFIKPYSGPSKTWFANQDSLSNGCNRLSTIISELPINEKTSKLLVQLLLRLDKKLSRGVDDSNGIVGGFMMEVVELLIDFAKQDPKTIKAFELLSGQRTCFEWEESLVRIVDEGI